MTVLQVEELSFRYDENEPVLFVNLSFDLKSGEILALHGDSGSGKTTLLYIINGVIPSHIKGIISGNIFSALFEYDKLQLQELAPDISMVMQNPAQQLFFPTVEQELAFAPENLCLPSHEIEKRIKKSLSLLNIEELRYSETAKLSYGQQKLTALAAIHTLEPKILLLDEISNGLSESRKSDVVNLIKSYAAEGKSVIIADHDAELLNIADKHIYLS